MGGWRVRNGPCAPLEEVLVPSSGAQLEPVHCLFPAAQAYRIKELRRSQSDEGRRSYAFDRDVEEGEQDEEQFKAADCQEVLYLTGSRWGSSVAAGSKNGMTLPMRFVAVLTTPAERNIKAL